MRRLSKHNPRQLQLAFDRLPDCPSEETKATSALGRTLRLVRGDGTGRPERLDSRDAVIRVLIEAGADLLLRRISSQRAEEIQQRVERIMSLFERVDRSPRIIRSLKRRLDELEVLMRETRALKAGKGR
jgi:hypothetical protein